MNDDTTFTDKFSNLSLAIRASGPPTMSVLAQCQRTLFPKPFDHEDVRKTVTQPRVVSESKHVDYDDPVEDDLGAPSSALNLKLDSDSTKSRVSAHSATPSKRATSKGTVATRRAWLTGWLLFVNMFFCHITHAEACAHLLIQFAHIILPQSERNNEILILFYEYILGMKPSTLFIHSRLFLLPLKNNIHVYFDDHIFIILPCLSVLKKMHGYFLQVVMTRTSAAPQSQKYLWNTLREGTDEFADGNIHLYHIVLHPGTNRTAHNDLLPFDKPDFYSHISPFAALLNAFRTLHLWYNARECPGYRPVHGQTLSNALEQSGIPDAKAILVEVRRIYSQILALKTSFEDESGPDWKPKRKGGGDDDVMRDFGLDGIDFGKWSGGEGGGGGDGGGGDGGADAGGSQRSHRGSALSDAPEVPLEDTILLLVPDELQGSTWSDDDSSDGMIVKEPGVHDPSTGPSPAQQIANDWWQANPPSTFPSIPPSAPSFVSTMTANSRPSISSSASSTTLDPSPSLLLPSAASYLKSNVSLDALHGKENRREGLKTRSSLNGVKAGSRTVTLRILRNFNVHS